VDSRERFSAAAEEYARYRPDYTDEVAHICADYARLTPGSTVVDLGCGTGISSRLFARHGYRVIGVEPNESMRAKAVQADGAEYRRGEAAATGLPDDSADLVIVAQALHWFDMDEVLPEMKRVTKPPHNCAAFWNLRSDEGWQREYDELLHRFSSQYPVASSDDNSGWVKSSPLCRDVTEHALGNAQKLDWNGLLGRVWSSSYMVHGDVDRDRFDEQLRKLFDHNQSGGLIEFKYRLYLLLWRIR
jgi:SAM-dependent methyltransferase